VTKCVGNAGGRQKNEQNAPVAHATFSINPVAFCTRRLNPSRGAERVLSPALQIASGTELLQAPRYTTALRFGGAKNTTLFSHPVINPRTFEETCLLGAPFSSVQQAQTILVVAPEDLALLKILAGRDQDVTDLTPLAGADALSASSLAQLAQHNDIEIRLMDSSEEPELCGDGDR